MILTIELNEQMKTPNTTPEPEWAGTLGLHKGVSEADYHALGTDHGVFSKSMLWAFARNPYLWRNGPRFAGNDATRNGSLTDCLALRGDFDTDFAIAPFADFRTKAAKEWKAEMATSGKTIVKQSEVDSAQRAADALWLDDRARELLAPSIFQASILADMGGGLRAKCRLDAAPVDASMPLVDLKTTASANMTSPAKMAANFANFGYHAQAAMYQRLWNEATGERRNEFVFIVQSTDAPYEVAIVTLSEHDLIAGRAWMADALERYRACIKYDDWPSPWSGRTELRLPEWAAGK